MTDRRLYTAVIPSGAFDPASGDSTVRRQLSKLAALEGAPAVEATGAEPGEFGVRGQFRGKHAERATTELTELLQADVLDAVALYGVGASTPADGYYTAERGTNSRLRPQTPGALSFEGDLTREGTRASHRRAVGTDPKQRPHPFGNATTAYVGVPAAASKVQWLDYERSQTTPATPDDTVAAEFGDVDRYDIGAAPSGYGDRPYLVYDLPLANAGDVDAAVFDTYGESRIDAEGDFAWGQVFRGDHVFDGDAVIENGRLRVTLDEAAQSTTAERYTSGSWSPVSLGASDWQLYDVDLTHPGAAQVRARLAFEDATSGDLFELEAVLHRGWDDLQFYSPAGLSVPPGLQTLLDPIAAGSVIDPQPERALIARSELR
jgi:hypothetical protein